jgi:phage gp36-like protein
VTDIQTPEGFLTLEVLEELTTEKGETVQLRTDRIEAIITDRSEFIDNHLRDRYPLPIAGNETLKNICVKLVTFDLKKKRLGSTLREPFKSMETEAIQQLEDIQRGLVQLNVGDSTNRPPYAMIKKRERVFTSEILGMMP